MPHVQRKGIRHDTVHIATVHNALDSDEVGVDQGRKFGHDLALEMSNHLIAHVHLEEYSITAG